MRQIFRSLLMVLLFSTLTIAANAQLHTSSSAGTTSYGGHYYHPGIVYQPIGVGNAPVQSMKSTRPASTISSAPAVGFVKIAALPSIDANGRAIGSAASAGPMHLDTRPGSGGGHTGTGGSSGEGTQIPVGGPMLPLLLLAGGYAALRKRAGCSRNE